ncbi:MAG: peptidoglycan DD-metalloendopeptidase family protein [Candidatus Colwellbacteria bacterium]|nr:peptidoglycan DD-metalloendopeptidase family protein [Candidatus Colwellbacteria bacterium]
MLSRLGKIIGTAFVAIILLVPSPVLAITEDELQKQIELKNKELEQINSQINQTQGVLDNLGSQSQSLSKEIKSTEYTIKNLELGIKSSEVNIDKLGLELQDLSGKLTDAEAKIKAKRETIASLIRALDEKESEGVLQIFLKGGSLTDSVAEVSRLSQLQGSLSDEVASLRAISEDINTNMEMSSEKKDQLETENSNYKNRKYIVEDQKTYKQTLLKQTKNQETVFQKQLSELEKKQISISDDIDNLEQALRKDFNASLSPGRGFLSKPFNGTRPLTQEYGATAFAKKAYSSGFHNGNDYGMPVGTPLIAAADGKIFAVGNNGKYQYGKYIVIKHTDNFFTLYAHMSRQSVSVGESVKKGQVIGYSGNTGYSTGAHLHFGVYQSVELKGFAGAGPVPVGITMNPADYY